MLCKEPDWTWWWLDRREDPIECLRRELIEEMWLVASSIGKAPIAFIATEKPWSEKRPRIANACYEVSLESLDFTSSDECVEIWFFDIEWVKDMKLLPNVLKVLSDLQK